MNLMDKIRQKQWPNKFNFSGKNVKLLTTILLRYLYSEMFLWFYNLSDFGLVNCILTLHNTTYSCFRVFQIICKKCFSYSSLLHMRLKINYFSISFSVATQFCFPFVLCPMQFLRENFCPILLRCWAPYKSKPWLWWATHMSQPWLCLVPYMSQPWLCWAPYMSHP